jgi:mRNA interferase MazF
LTEPRRGQIWLISLGAAKGGEPGKNRPAVIVSADELSTASERDLFVVVPLSASRFQSPLRPVVAASTGVSRSSVAVCTAVRSVSRGRLLRPVGQLDRETLSEVEFALSLVLGLD